MTSNGSTNGSAQVAQPAVKQQQPQTNVSIEDLYKHFGVLADAKEDAGKVNFFSLHFLFIFV